MQVNELRQLVGRLKARSVVGWINEFLRTHPKEKLLVFSWHRPMARVLARHCQALSVVIDGSVIGDRRKARLDQFLHDRNCRLLLGNVRAVGVGVDGLQRVCHHVAFAELPWQPALILQAEDRCYRIGQEWDVSVHYLVARGTIEEKLCGMLERKQGHISTVLDGGRRRGDLAIYKLLLQSIRQS